MVFVGTTWDNEHFYLPEHFFKLISDSLITPVSETHLTLLNEVTWAESYLTSWDLMGINQTSSLNLLWSLQDWTTEGGEGAQQLVTQRPGGSPDHPLWHVVEDQWWSGCDNNVPHTEVFFPSKTSLYAPIQVNQGVDEGPPDRHCHGQPSVHGKPLECDQEEFWSPRIWCTCRNIWPIRENENEKNDVMSLNVNLLQWVTVLSRDFAAVQLQH